MSLRFASLLSLFAFACSPGLDVGSHDDSVIDVNDSNIESPDIGAITELKVLPNTNVPRAVFVKLETSEFVADLYDHIRAINDAERLEGTEGYDQRINLIVAVPPQDWAVDYQKFSHLLGVIRQRRGLASDAEVPLVDSLENVTNWDQWMQDFGEFAAVRGESDPGRRWYGLFDSGKFQEGGIDVAEIGRRLGIAATRVAGEGYNNGGNAGGNIEATAEGTLYVGDHATPDFIAGLRKLGNPDAIVLPSKWLQVGHVDEYLTVVPARNACHSAFMVAAPLEALNMARRAPGEFSSIEIVPGQPMSGLPEAIDGFSLRRRPLGEDYVLSDFDLTREPTSEQERFVRINLEAQVHAEAAVETLKAGACVGEVIPLPQLYLVGNRDWNAGGALVGDRELARAAFPNTPNSLVLRSHVVVPDPKIESIRRVVKKRFARALGSEANVHFIDDQHYFSSFGDVHCATNVVRDIDLAYRLGR